MDRRTFLGALAGGLLAAPLAAEAGDYLSHRYGDAGPRSVTAVPGVPRGTRSPWLCRGA